MFSAGEPEAKASERAPMAGLSTNPISVTCEMRDAELVSAPLFKYNGTYVLLQSVRVCVCIQKAERCGQSFPLLLLSELHLSFLNEEGSNAFLQPTSLWLVGKVSLQQALLI